MVRRAARCYSMIDRKPYTRKEYIKGGPESKIRIFDAGSPGKEFGITIGLFAEKDRQVAHNALEAARVTVNRYISEKIDKEKYHFKICVYPHHIIRENKILSGAGADRVSDGMRLAFGRPMGRAARVYTGQRILYVRVDKENFALAKEAVRRARYKFPMTCTLKIEKGEELTRK